MISLTDVMLSIRPTARWTIKNESEIIWQDEEQVEPSESEIQAEKLRLENIQMATEYQRKRAKEYPPITDYIDAVVKNDIEQMQAYVDACLAVKAKYPKPE